MIDAAAELIGTFGKGASPEKEVFVEMPQLVDAFARDVAALHPVLATILSGPTLAGVTLASAAPSRLRYDDDLWAATVFEFVLAYHRAVMTREHVTRTLLPLYLGRTAAFLLEHASSSRPACPSTGRATRSSTAIGKRCIGLRSCKVMALPTRSGSRSTAQST